jgi:hypothetical protein
MMIFKEQKSVTMIEKSVPAGLEPMSSASAVGVITTQPRQSYYLVTSEFVKLLYEIVYN